VTLLLTLLIMAVIGLVAAVAAGRIGGGLDDPASSLPGRGLPPGPFSLEDVDRVRFSPALRGYRMDEVDDVIDRLVDELRRLEEEVAELRGRGATGHSSSNGRYLPGDGWTDGYGDFRRPAPTASSPPTSSDDDGIGDR
jgi:DivIVA domain-containing protein